MTKFFRDLILVCFMSSLLFHLCALFFFFKMPSQRSSPPSPINYVEPVGLLQSRPKITAQKRMSRPQSKTTGTKILVTKDDSSSNETLISDAPNAEPIEPIGGNGFIESTGRLSFLAEIYRRVDSGVVINWEILHDVRMASATLQIEVGPDGKLLRFISSSSEIRAFAANIRGQVAKVLSQEFPNSLKIKSNVVVALNFFVEVESSLPLPAPPPMTIVQDYLSFFRYRYSPFLFEAHETLDGTGKIVDIRLEVLFKKLFGKKPVDPTRVHWDLEMKLREAITACEVREAEGACFIAGKIEEAFNNIAHASELYSLACRKQVDGACEAQSHLKTVAGTP